MTWYARIAGVAPHDPECELLDTGILDTDRYYDVFVEYAKADPRTC